jgi:hypothetical protein
MSMSDPASILGDWQMRRGDRLPLLAVAVEDDQGVPVDLTGARAYFQFRCDDGTFPVTLPDTAPPLAAPGYDWLILQGLVYNGPAGIVAYDWTDDETSTLTIAVMELVVSCLLPDGSWVTAPSDRAARLIVRPELYPGFVFVP